MNLWQDVQWSLTAQRGRMLAMALVCLLAGTGWVLGVQAMQHIRQQARDLWALAPAARWEIQLPSGLTLQGVERISSVLPDSSLRAIAQETSGPHTIEWIAGDATLQDDPPARSGRVLDARDLADHHAVAVADYDWAMENLVRSGVLIPVAHQLVQVCGLQDLASGHVRMPATLRPESPPLFTLLQLDGIDGEAGKLRNRLRPAFHDEGIAEEAWTLIDRRAKREKAESLYRSSLLGVAGIGVLMAAGLLLLVQQLMRAQTLARKAEIGLRLSMGARRGAIRGQFVLEASIVSFLPLALVAAVIIWMAPEQAGRQTLAGLAALWLVAALSADRVARVAARMDPADCIRQG